MSTDFDITHELRELAAWRRANGDDRITLLDLLGFVATLDSLAAHLALFDPEIVIHRGARFISSGFDVPTFEAWLAQGLTLTEVQRAMNHVHVGTIMQAGASDGACDWFATRLASVWRRTIPGAVVTVEGRGFHEASVTFHDAILEGDHRENE